MKPRVVATLAWALWLAFLAVAVSANVLALRHDPAYEVVADAGLWLAFTVFATVGTVLAWP
ncbi:MAG: hypothetical protein LC799_35485 [Actinobacteria bacterium]|nr:hypothetical protein [Actinomycetota bacterium]